MKQQLRILVTGLIAQHHALAGVTWDYLQYVLGLHQMGHEVYYFEDSGEWPYTPDGGPTGDQWVAPDCQPNIEHLQTVLGQFGLKDRWAYHFPNRSEWYGLPDASRESVIESADLLINVSGTLEHPERYEKVRRRVYIDSDPGFTQVKMKLQQKEFVRRVMAHDVHFSFGEAQPPHLQHPEIRWLPTRTPIVLSQWPSAPNPRTTYTTVMNWTSYRPLVCDGIAYRQKDSEFVKFLELPQRMQQVPFEVALSKVQHANWQSSIAADDPQHAALNLSKHGSPRSLLEHHGWHVVDPATTCADLETYRSYITRSRAEWSVAKGGYVVSRPGWFSCRSACYLAAGRPVVVQDTGFSSVLPVGEGILSFRTLDEAIWGVEEVERDYARHSGKAREIAGEYFDASRVLSELIQRADS
jgi:hypothetical protein